jgi:hypothetical protein
MYRIDSRVQRVEKIMTKVTRPKPPRHIVIRVVYEQSCSPDDVVREVEAPIPEAMHEINSWRELSTGDRIRVLWPELEDTEGDKSG